MTAKKPSSLAEILAAAASASLRAQGLDSDAAAFTVESVAEQLGAAGVEVKKPSERVSDRAAQAITLARKRRLAEAADAITPADVPRATPEVKSWRPVKPWASQRSRARFVAAIARTSNPRFNPRDWTDRAWATVRAGFCDTTGRRACFLLGEIPQSLAHRARLAILHEQQARGDDRPGVDWSHITARGIAACAVVLYRESVATKKRGFARVLVGVSQGMFASLFRNPQGGRNRGTPHYHVNSLFATEVHGDKSRGGWVRTLERAGFVHIEQPPAEAVPASLVGPSGYALGQYWITERAAVAPVSEAQRRVLDSARALTDEWSTQRSAAPPPPT